MSSLLIRFILFIAFLLAGFSLGWEFLLVMFIFLIAIGKAYWEYVFSGFMFDILLGFPAGFFTVVFSAILIAALLADDFFKSDSLFNQAMRGILASLMAVFIFFIFFLHSIWPDFSRAIEASGIIFIKIIAALAAVLLLSKLIEQKFAAKEIF